MRLELFAKDTPSLVASARALVGYNGVRGINIPHKTKEFSPIAALQALQSELPERALQASVPHYSLKFAYGGSPEIALRQFQEFCEAASALPTPPREVLLVSGSGKRHLDSVKCLRSLPSKPPIGVGVAFNPFLPERADRERERARLRLKLGTGKVSAVWLQLGSDLNLLEDGLRFVRQVLLPSHPELRVYGSVFIPSRQLLAQMRFRPWSGVFLDDDYLSSVASAEAVTRRVVELYARFGVETLIETPIRSEGEWAHARRLCTPAEALDGADGGCGPHVAPTPTTSAAMLPPDTRGASSTTATAATAATAAAAAAATTASAPTAALAASDRTSDRPAKRAKG
jgi:hypothetical protein